MRQIKVVISYLGEYNSDNFDPLQHQSLSDTPDRHCSQMHEQDLCHPKQQHSFNSQHSRTTWVSQSDGQVQTTIQLGSDLKSIDSKCDELQIAVH